MDAKQLTQKELKVYEAAGKLLAKRVTAPEFSARVFGEDGLLRPLWGDEKERKALVASELYRWLQEELAKLRRWEVGEFEKEIESLSGRLTVVVPKSLHAALKEEAVLEGISLSELIRLKLSTYSYRDMMECLSRRGGDVKSGCQAPGHAGPISPRKLEPFEPVLPRRDAALAASAEESDEEEPHDLDASERTSE